MAPPKSLDSIPPDIVIRSEDDAFVLLEKAQAGTLGEYNRIVFDGWPTLSLKLKGEKFEQSITPTVMKGLLEFQKGIYQAYASAGYGLPTKRLTGIEKDALEIRVGVEGGSSEFKINFQEIANKLVDHLVDKMDSKTLAIIVVSISLMYFGKSSYVSYLETKKAEKIQTSSDDSLKAALAAIRFGSEEETKRARIFAEMAKGDARLENIGRIAHDTQTGIVRVLAAGTEATLVSTKVPPSIAGSLTQNARRKSSEIRLDGNYRLLKLDWSNSDRFKVKVINVDNGLKLDAEVQDETFDGKYKDALKKAEWERKPVFLEVNAKLLSEDEFRDAVIIHVEAERVKK